MEETMKCLKSSKTGEIIRVTNEKADQATREWKFIPKSEWKALRPPVSEKQVEDQEKKETTLSEKALRRKKLGEKQREAVASDNVLK
jgi:gamma-glutamylcysteine synthetase